MEKTGIDKKIVSFLKASSQDVFSLWEKELADNDLPVNDAILDFGDQLYADMIATFSGRKDKRQDLDQAIKDLMEMAKEKSISFAELMKIMARFRYCLVKYLLIYFNKEMFVTEAWFILVNRLDKIQALIYEYAFSYSKILLRQTEARYRRMVEVIREGLFIVDNKFQVIFCNKPLCKILGKEKNKVEKCNIKKILGPENSQILSDFLEALRQGVNQRRSIEITYQYDKNNIKYLAITPNFLTENGQAIGVQATVRNVTERQQMEKKLYERYEKMQQAYLELGKVNRQMASLIDISSIVSTDLEPQEVFRFILSSIAILSEADTASLRVHNPKRDTLELVSTYKMPKMWSNAKVLKVKGSVSGHAFKTRASIKVDNMAKDKKHTYRAIMFQYDLRAMYALPLVVAGKPVGVLSLYSREEQKFRQVNEELISALVGQAGIALKLLL